MSNLFNNNIGKTLSVFWYSIILKFEGVLKIIFCILLLSFTSCTKRPLVDTSDMFVAETVNTIIAIPEEIQPKLESFGNLSFVRKADITVSVEGTYDRLIYEEGDSVRAGALVAELSNIQLEIQLARAESAVTSAEAGLRLARANYEEGINSVEGQLLGLDKAAMDIERKNLELAELTRAEEDQQALFDIGGITEVALRSAKLSRLIAAIDLQTLITDLSIRKIGFRNEDIMEQGLPVPEDETERKQLLIKMNTRTLFAQLGAAEAALASAKKELESAQALVDELSLYSPIAGIVGQRSPEVGEKASDGDSIYVIFESGPMHVVFPIQESDVISVTQGASVNVAIDAFPEAQFTATVDRISPMVDPQSGNSTVRALLDQSNPLLQPGMFARISLHYGLPRTAIFLPANALVENRGNTGKLFIVKNGIAFTRRVDLGLKDDNRIEIANGLDKGELVIDDPSPLLREGQEVKIENP